MFIVTDKEKLIQDSLYPCTIGEEVKGVGVMKDEKLKLQEIEASYTLGGYRRLRCYSAVRLKP